MSIDLLLTIAACICFALAAVGVPAPRINLTALGLLLWALTGVVS